MYYGILDVLSVPIALLFGEISDTSNPFYWRFRFSYLIFWIEYSLLKLVILDLK